MDQWLPALRLRIRGGIRRGLGSAQADLARAKACCGLFLSTSHAIHAVLFSGACRRVSGLYIRLQETRPRKQTRALLKLV